jgi:hypothetical protein
MATRLMWCSTTTKAALCSLTPTHRPLQTIRSSTAAHPQQYCEAFAVRLQAIRSNLASYQPLSVSSSKETQALNHQTSNKKK